MEIITNIFVSQDRHTFPVSNIRNASYIHVVRITGAVVVWFLLIIRRYKGFKLSETVRVAAFASNLTTYLVSSVSKCPLNKMQCNIRTTDAGRTQTGCVSSRDELEQVHKRPTRQIPYRVGYDWNKCGRLMELRKR